MMLATVFSLVARRSWLGYSSLHNLHSMHASMSTFNGGGGGQDGGVTIDYSEYTLVFDLDGTLVDSSASLQKAVNDFLLEEGYTGRTLTRKEVEPLMGDGINIVAARALQMVGLAARGDVGKTLGDIYDKDPSLDLTKLYPLVIETLSQLQSSKFKMVVCTNKAQQPAMEILNYFKLTKFFDSHCVGGDVLAVRKPHAEHLTHAVSLKNGNPSKVFMIGDGHNDVAVAKNANVPCIALSWGYSRVPLETLNPELIIDSFAAIPAAIDDILSRKKE